MTPYFESDGIALYLGDCREVLPRVLADASVDAIVTDPPYEYAFMGRRWDSTGVAFDVATWEACLRVLKPGGHLLAFGAPRTWHRLAVAIEDAGFEIRDSLQWVYGSGFPKNLDVSKAIDKAAGAARKVIGEGASFGSGSLGNRARVAQGYRPTELNPDGGTHPITAPATEDAARWSGWGTALKPGWEPIILARKPLAGTVAANVLEHSTGALNIDGCRIGSADKLVRPAVQRRDNDVYGKGLGAGVQDEPVGRWPTNLVFSHSPECVEDEPCAPDCPVAELDRQSGVTRDGVATNRNRSGVMPRAIYGQMNVPPPVDVGYGGSGGASRFFPTFRYEGKAPSSERPKLDDGTAHATVKPLDLIRWLARLITPPGGLILDPFGGSGTTAEAALIENFRSVLVELEPAHAELIKARLSKPIAPMLDLGGSP